MSASRSRSSSPTNRYLAEDALDLIEVDYEPLPAVVDPLAALDPTRRCCTRALASNLASERSVPLRRSGARLRRSRAHASRSPSAIRAIPARRSRPMASSPNTTRAKTPTTCSPISMGPFSLHAVMARALKVPGNRLRLRTPPDSGGSFGVKQGVFPYVVLMGVAARVAGRPVKWIEDRLEHLAASVSATNRVDARWKPRSMPTAACSALAWDQIEDFGAHIRAPEPATLYRMHGNITGAYDIRHVVGPQPRRPDQQDADRPQPRLRRSAGLFRAGAADAAHRGRARARSARRDPQEPGPVRRLSLPHRDRRAARFRRLPEGASKPRWRDGGFAELRERRDAARAQGRIYGIGFTAAVEPSVSNMGYITTVLTPEERRKAGPKNGAQATATVALDPLGGVSRARRLGAAGPGPPHRAGADRRRRARPQAVRHPRRHRARHRTRRLVDRIRQLFAAASPPRSPAPPISPPTRSRRSSRAPPRRSSTSPARDVEFAGGRARARGNPDNAVPFARLAAASHWSPGLVPEDNQAIRETVFWTPPELTAPTEQDEINSSLCHGFIFDFCGVEIDRVTGAVRIDKYVTMHDCGAILHPGMVAGQITRRLRPGGRRGALRRICLWRGRRFPDRHLRRLSGADRDGGAGAGDPPFRDARRPSRRSAPRASAKATACRRRSASPTRSPMRSASRSSTCR